MNLGTLLEDIERDEGYRQFVYDDRTGKPPLTEIEGKLTIGFGFNLTDVGLSREECQLIAAHRLRKVEDHLKQALPWYSTLTVMRQNALANMGYQLGVTKLLTFRDMLAAMNAGDFDKAADESLDSIWADQTDGKLDGKDGDRALRVAAAIREG